MDWSGPTAGEFLFQVWWFGFLLVFLSGAFAPEEEREELMTLAEKANPFQDEAKTYALLILFAAIFWPVFLAWAAVKK